jgi:hydrogenase nickel incorporation protein HypA/HybF
MHELGIIAAALDATRLQAAREGSERVVRIVLRVGSLAGVDVAALRFAYEALAPGSVAEGATLDIEDVPARAWCRRCDAEFGGSRGLIFQCPFCQEYSGEIRAGRELGISRIEFALSP